MQPKPHFNVFVQHHGFYDEYSVDCIIIIQWLFDWLIEGVHSLEALYAGETIPGSPLLTEFFDPARIVVEGTRTGTSGEPLILDG